MHKDGDAVDNNGLLENLKAKFFAVMSKRRIDLDAIPGKRYEHDPSFHGEDHYHEGESERNPLTGVVYSKKYHDILKKRKELPCWEARSKFLHHVHENQVTLIVGATGSGKTTQLPQFVLEEGYSNTGLIACTQPRRVAAMSVAARVADELDVKLGQQVGYSIRFEDCTSQSTLLKYMTDGMLLREAMIDPTLSKYSVVMLDEAHERTLATDLLFGLLKALLVKRPDLKLIVMSATLESDTFSKYFDDQAPLLNIPGRVYPVDIFYSREAEADYVEACIRTAVDIHTQEPEGDILIFLTGEEEIETACEKIKLLGNRSISEHGELRVVPLYSSLPPQMQQRIFDRAPEGGRKCIVSTNIAETSLTIDGVVYVIDPGFSKQKVYNPRTKIESLLPSPISQASANQRAGRAGRTKPGKCFRLYTERGFNSLQQSTYPEILRSNLASVVLTMKKLGIEDLVHFDFISPPAPETLMRALELLNYIGALDDEAELTKLGEQLAEYPLDPQLALTLVAAGKYGVAAEALSLVAMMSVPQCFLRPKDQAREADAAKAQFEHQDGDHMTLLTAYQVYAEMKRSFGDEGHLAKWCRDNFINPRTMRSAESVRSQLERINVRLGIPTASTADPKSPGYSAAVRKALLTGYFLQVAHVVPNKNIYTPVNGKSQVRLHPSSSIMNKPEWVVYNEYVVTTSNYIRTVTSIRPEWLIEIAPHYFALENMETESSRTMLAKVVASLKRRPM